MAKSTSNRKTTASSVSAAPIEQPIRQLTAEEVAALVSSWDAARTELRDAGEAVAQLQTKIDALAPDADRSAIDGEMLTAQGRAELAQKSIEGLTPLPEGVTLPDAVLKTHTEGTSTAVVVSPNAPAAATAEPVLAAGTEGSLTQPVATHTTQSDDDRLKGETGNAAGLAASGPLSGRDDLNVADVARAEFGWQLDRARRMVADGSIQEGLDFLLERRAEVTLMATLTVEFGTALDVEIAALSSTGALLVSGTVTVTAKAGSRWRAGREFTKETRTFQSGVLTADELLLLQGDDLLTVTVAH